MLITIGFIVIVIILNFITSILVERFPIDIDLTSNQAFKLTQESIDYIESLDKEITIDILADEKTFQNASEYYAQAAKVIEQYTRYSDKIKLLYTDIYSNPEVASKYSDHSIEYGDIIVSSEVRSQKVSAYDLFNVTQNQYQSYISSSNAEQAMTGAILYVTDPKPVTVSILSGQGESDISGLVDILKRNSYEVLDQNILTEDVNQAASIAIIAAPTRDYTAEQLEKLDKFMDNEGQLGKTIIYLASAEQPDLPNISDFLEEWGIQVQNNIIFETDSSKIYLSPLFTLQNIEDSSLIGDTSNMPPIVIPTSRALNQVYENNGNIETKVMLSTYPTAAIRPFDSPETWSTADAIKGSYNTSILSVKSETLEEDIKTSNLLAFGSSEIFLSELLNSSSIGNSNYILDIVNSLAEKENVVKIIPKEVGGVNLGINEQQVFVLTIVFLLIVPIIVIIFGAIVWFKRRNL